MGLRSNQKALQVKVGGTWEYVFCRNPLRADPIATQSRHKALPGRALTYFETKFPNHQFRID